MPKLETCVTKLTDDEVWWRANEESNSVGNLLLHLAGNARQWIVSGVGGGADRRVRQREFDERGPLPRNELLKRLKQTMKEVDKVLSTLDAQKLLEYRTIQGYNVTVLDAVFHVVEHFAMHTGQIILITKMLKSLDMEFYAFLRTDNP